jgi:hypothetical protein
MSLILRFSPDIVISVFSNWLLLKDITFCNSAFCNETERINFEKLICNNTFAITEQIDWCSEYSAMSEKYQIKKWNWILLKQIHLKDMMFYDIKLLDQLQIIGNFKAARIEKLNFTDVKINQQHTGELLIQFINQCERLKALCFNKCDLLNGNEFISTLNIGTLDELKVINCELSCVGSNSLSFIANKTKNLQKCHLLKTNQKEHQPLMRFSDFETLLSRNGASLIDLFLSIDLREQMSIDHREIFKLVKTLIHCLSVRIKYIGNLSVIQFSDIWSCINKNDNVLRIFEIVPVFSEKNITTFSYWSRKTGSNDSINGLDMCNVECTSDELVLFFQMFKSFGMIQLNRISSICADVLSAIVKGSCTSLKRFILEECGLNLRIDDIQMVLEQCSQLQPLVLDSVDLQHIKLYEE